MKSKGGEFAGNCISHPPNLHQTRTTSLPSADSSETMPKGCEPVCASMCYSVAMGHSPQPQEKALEANCIPASLFHFHLLPLQVCCLGTASLRLEIVSLVTGEKHCSLLCPYPWASRPAVTNCQEQALVYSMGKVCKSSSSLFACIHTLKINAESFSMVFCLLQSLPMPLRYRQLMDNQNYFVFFSNTGNWNFRASKSTDPRLYPATKRTISSARCNPICEQALGANRTHGMFHSCL